jgi:photosystem II stability/assembly factor-like uncharacterized protein
MKIILLTAICSVLNLFIAHTAQAQDWEQIGNLDGSPLSITFADDNVGWVADEEGKIWKTVNGGKSWDIVLDEKKIGFHNTWTMIKFIDTMQGIFCSFDEVDSVYLARIYTSKDGGKNWSEVLKDTLKNFEIPRSIILINNSIIGLFSKSLYKTDNWGKSWKKFTLPHGSWYSITYTDSLNLWVAGDLGSLQEIREYIIHSTDGGLTWEDKYDFYQTGYHEIQRVNSTIFGINPVGMIYTKDNGKNWKSFKDNLNVKNYPHFEDLIMLNEDVGYIAGFHSIVKVSISQEKFASTEITPYLGWISHIASSPSKRFIWAFTHNGYVYKHEEKIVSLTEVQHQKASITYHEQSIKISLPEKKINGMIKIYDLLGAERISQLSSNTNNEIIIDCNSLEQGIYFIDFQGIRYKFNKVK